MSVTEVTIHRGDIEAAGVSEVQVMQGLEPLCFVCEYCTTIINVSIDEYLEARVFFVHMKELAGISDEVDISERQQKGSVI